MTELWINMGFIRYPLALVTVLMLVQTVRASASVGWKGDHHGASLRIHSVLVLGVLGACVGVLGTLVGLMVAATSVEQAGAVNPTLMWGGVKVALISSVVGLLVLGVSAVSWLGLQYTLGRNTVAAD